MDQNSSSFAAWANIIAAFVIAAFAVLQWKITKRAEENRQSERQQDRDEALDAAYATVHAEWFRIWTVSRQWSASDLTNPAIVASLSADDILPQSWSSITQHLGRLGAITSQLGSFGLALANDAYKQARALFVEVDAYNRLRPDDAAAANAFDAEHHPRLQGMADKLTELAEEAANLLEDAIAHAPPASVPREFKLQGDLKSRLSKHIAAQLPQVAPTPERARLLFGRFRITPREGGGEA